MGDIGLRLVVVVVGDKVFHRILGEKRFHLAVELRRQRFIRRQHQCWTLDIGDQVGDGEGFAAASDAQQGLMSQAVIQADGQGVNRVGLIAIGVEVGA